METNINIGSKIIFSSSYKTEIQEIIKETTTFWITDKNIKISKKTNKPVGKFLYKYINIKLFKEENLEQFNPLQELTTKDIENQHIGNKTKKLLILKDNDFNISEKSFLLNLEKINEENIFNLNLDLFEENTLYAVRSSAIGEDGDKNSFAGIFKSILNVKKENLIEAIIEVNKSFYSRKAIVYSDVRKTSFKPSILIQKMVRSDYSVVMFVADNKIELNFTKGLCEQIVSGTCNTLELVFDLKDKDIEENLKKLDKEFYIKYNINIKEIIDNIPKLKELFGDYLDIEMTFNSEENKWYYLQIRNLIH